MLLREMTSSALAPSFKRFARCAVLGLALAGLAACGGGGGSSTPAATAPTTPTPSTPPEIPITQDHPDTLEAAVVVAAGATVEGSIGSADDVDFFKVQLTDPGTVTFWTTGEADTVIGLLDGEGADLSPTVSEGRVSKATTLDEVFARVSGRDGSTGQYALHNTFAGEQRRARAPGERFRDCPECPQMVVVPAGSFMMGEPEESLDFDGFERPVHQVDIRSFAVGVYEVTFEEWDACMDDEGCGPEYRRGPDDDAGWGRGNRPVINVDWNDMQAYVRWLSEKTGKEYRLLSESEWEYVARAGTTTRYWWGNDIGVGRANCGSSLPGEKCGSQWDFRRTAPVDSFEANPFGLYNVHGNVWECVEDCWNSNYEGAPTDGSAWLSGDCGNRVVRGGSWSSAPGDLRSANRTSSVTCSTVSPVLGFRVARTLTP